MFFDVALGAGSVIGGLLAQTFPLRTVFLMAALSSGVGMIVLTLSHHCARIKTK